MEFERKQDRLVCKIKRQATEAKSNTFVLHDFRARMEDQASPLQLKGCIECGKSSGHKEGCSRGPKPKPQPALPTDDELAKEASKKVSRMAGTHHEKTGVKGTPSARLEQWAEENYEDVLRRLKEGRDKNEDERKKKDEAAAPFKKNNGPKPPRGGGGSGVVA